MLVAQESRPPVERPAPLVKRFLDHVFVECGLAGLTVTAYRADLRGFWNFLTAHDIHADQITIEDIQRYLMALQKRGLALSSVARHLATVKMFLRFLFAIELEQICSTQPHDSDIDCCRWVSAEEILQASNLRSPLVAESIRCYQSGQRYPLEMIGDFNWPFIKGVI